MKGRARTSAGPEGFPTHIFDRHRACPWFFSAIFSIFGVGGLGSVGIV